MTQQLWGCHGNFGPAGDLIRRTKSPGRFGPAKPIFLWEKWSAPENLVLALALALTIFLSLSLSLALALALALGNFGPAGPKLLGPFFR